MTLKSLTPSQLRREREHLEMQLSNVMFAICSDRNADMVTEMHREWDRQRYRNQIDAINIELELRK